MAFISEHLEVLISKTRLKYCIFKIISSSQREQNVMSQREQNVMSPKDHTNITKISLNFTTFGATARIFSVSAPAPPWFAQNGVSFLDCSPNTAASTGTPYLECPLGRAFGNLKSKYSWRHHGMQIIGCIIGVWWACCQCVSHSVGMSGVCRYHRSLLVYSHVGRHIW